MKNEKKLTILLTYYLVFIFFFQKTADATHNSKITKPFTILTKQLVVYNTQMYKDRLYLVILHSGYLCTSSFQVHRTLKRSNSVYNTWHKTFEAMLFLWWLMTWVKNYLYWFIFKYYWHYKFQFCHKKLIPKCIIIICNTFMYLSSFGLA